MALSPTLPEDNHKVSKGGDVLRLYRSKLGVRMQLYDDQTTNTSIMFLTRREIIELIRYLEGIT